MKKNILKLLPLILLLILANINCKKEDHSKAVQTLPDSTHTKTVQTLLDSTQGKTVQNENKSEIDSVLLRIKNAKSLSDVFELEKTIKIKYKDENIFNGMHSLFVDDNEHILCNVTGVQQKIYVFDKQGKQTACLNNRGQGPGEYLSIECYSSDKDYIYLYDRMQNVVNLYNISGVYKKSFKVKEMYSSIETDEGNIYLRRIPIYDKHESFDKIDVYDKTGKFKSTISIPLTAETERYKIIGGDWGLIKNNNIMYIVNCDDFKIYAYDISNSKLLFTSNELPNWVRIEKKLPEQDKFFDWHSKSSSFRSINIYQKGYLQLWIDNYFVFYDLNGNYLNSVKRNQKVLLYTVNGDKLYEFCIIPGKSKNDKTELGVNVYKFR